MKPDRKTPGELLRNAREEQGKTLSEMGKITRIGIQQLQGLEDDNYDRIPAPMYVRGFIKLYAKKLGLNPDPLLDLYERMSNGEPLSDEPAVVATGPVETKSPEKVPIQRTEQQSFEHPEISRQVSEPSVSYTKMLTETLSDYVNKLKGSLDFGWARSLRTYYILGGILVFFIFLAGLRSCGSEDDVETDASEIPQVDEPLLSPPEPVYFQLPSSYP